jgi:hypothetical protein
VLIIPSSWGSQLIGHFHHHHRSNQAIFLAPLPGIEEEEDPTSNTRSPVNLAPSNINFSAAVAGEKEDFCKESFARTSFTLF